MRASWILPFCLFLAADLRASERTETWRIAGVPEEILISEHAWISAKCEKNQCQAGQALGKAKPLKASAKSANTSSQYCDAAKGRSVLGTDKAGNEEAFCRFADGSLVASASLLKAAGGKKKPNYNLPKAE